MHDYPLPKTKIVNLNLKKIKNSFVSDESIKIVKKFLEKKEQVLFFLNRRGYAPYLICKNCGYKQICNNCSMYLTFHKIKIKLSVIIVLLKKKYLINVKMKKIVIL